MMLVDGKALREFTFVDDTAACLILKFVSKLAWELSLSKWLLRSFSCLLCLSVSRRFSDRCFAGLFLTVCWSIVRHLRNPQKTRRWIEIESVFMKTWRCLESWLKSSHYLISTRTPRKVKLHKWLSKGQQRWFERAKFPRVVQRL